MADPRDQDPNATPTPREEQVARNVGADPADPHESPANPDNRISVSRRAADAENAQQIIENAPEMTAWLAMTVAIVARITRGSSSHGHSEPQSKAMPP